MNTFMQRSRFPFSSMAQKVLYGLILLGLVAAMGFMAYENVLLPLLILSMGLMAVLVMFFPELFTLTVIFLIYLNAATVAVRFHNVPLLIGALFPALLLLPISRYLVFGRQKLVINLPFTLMLVFLFIQAIGALFSARPDIVMDKISTYLTEGVGLYLLVINSVRTPRMLKWTVIILVAAAAVMGSLSLYQEMTHSYNNNYWGFAQAGNTFTTDNGDTLDAATSKPRLTGPIGEINRYGQIMVMTVPLALAIIAGTRNRKVQLLFLVAAFMIIAGAVLTYSRGAMLTLGVVMAGIFMMGFVKVRYLPLFLIPLLLIPLVVPDFAARLNDLSRIDVSSLWSDAPQSSLDSASQSIRSRATEMIASWLMFADNPIIGVGSGNYPVHYHEYAREVALVVRLANRQPHILYGGIAAENGILGLGCFLAIVGVTLKDLFAARLKWQKKDPVIAAIVSGLILGVVAYMVSGLFLHWSYIRYLWLYMAVAGAAGVISKAEFAVEPARDQFASARTSSTFNGMPASTIPAGGGVNK